MSLSSLRSNFAWALSGNAVFALCQWVQLIAIARFGGEGMAGDWGLANAIVVPIVVFSQLKLRQVQVTDARGEHAFGHFLALRIVFAGLAWLTAVAVAGVGYTQPVIVLVGALVLSKVFDLLSDIAYGLFQQRERMELIARSMIARGVVGAAAAVGVLVTTGSLLGSMLALALVYAVGAAWYLEQARRILRAEGRPWRPAWQCPALRSLLLMSLPLAAATAIGTLQAQLPRYFIEGSWGREALGVYTALAALLALGQIVIGAIAQAAVPRLAAYHAAGDREAFKRLVLRMVGMGAGLGAVGFGVAVVAGRPIVHLVYGPSFAAHHGVLSWLMLSSAIVYAYVFMGTAANAMRLFRIQAPIHAVSTLAVLGVAAFAVPRYGLPGAAWSLIVGATVEALLYTVVVRAQLAAMPERTP